MSVIQRYHHHKYIIGLCHFFYSHLTFGYSGCSSCSHTWDAFQLAHASFRLYCVRNNYVQSVKLGPRLLGDAPKINIIPAENDVDEEEGCSEAFLAIKIYDEDVNMKFLVCGVPCTLVCLILSFNVFLVFNQNDCTTVSIAGCMFVGRTGGWFECSVEY